MAQIMNINWNSRASVERALGEQILAILSGVPWLNGVRLLPHPGGADSGFDYLVGFSVPRGPDIELGITLRSSGKTEVFLRDDISPRLNEAPFGQEHIPVLAAPHLSPRMRELCESHGWGWYDLAGNCRISIPPFLHLVQSGHAPVRRPLKPSLNLSTPEAGRVIRTLLAPENEGVKWTQRKLHAQENADVSLGMVNKVIRFLREEAYIHPLPRGGFTLSHPVQLLYAWRDAYRFDLHKRLEYFTLLSGEALRAALSNMAAQCEGGAAYAVFSAAEIQAPHVRQAKTWLYVDPGHLSKLKEWLQAKPVDSGGNLVVLIPQDPGVFALPHRGGEGNSRMVCTNPVQTYIDLWHSGGRGQEAAEALLNQWLKPAWLSLEVLT